MEITNASERSSIFAARLISTVDTLSEPSWRQGSMYRRVFNTGGSSLPDVVNTDPSGCVEATCGSKYGNAHFVVLNQYFNGSNDTGTDGYVSDTGARSTFVIFYVMDSGDVWFYTYRLNQYERRWELFEYPLL